MQSTLQATLRKGLSQQLKTQGMRAVSSVTNPADAVLSGANAQYVDLMYQKWRADPAAVHSSWDAYFRTGAFVAPPNVVPGGNMVAGTPIGASAAVASGAATVDVAAPRVLELIRAYQNKGHAIASLDPIGFSGARLAETHPELTPEYYGLTDMNKVVDLKSFGDSAGFLGSSGSMTVGQIVELLKKTYSSTVGYEINHVASTEELNWLKNKIEAAPATYDKSYKMRLLNRLAYATQFETFLKSKYNVKRFGLEGNESTIVSLREILKVSTEHGVESAVFGMPHRGRLNVLVNVIKKPLEIMFSEFTGNNDADTPLKKVDGVYQYNYKEFPLSGDVKYHHGWSSVNELDNGKKIHCTLIPNPSHLETVNPLVQGKARAKQFFAGDEDGSKVLSIMLHGDAAFSGQGVVFESLAMHGLSDYNVGGTIHVVVNNQIGFTTDPYKSRSGPYATDVAKAFQVPVFHVNANDVEAVNRVSALAAEYRAKFKKDVVLDIIGWRLNGHNELDQPSFTQPLMYKKIAALPTIFDSYKNELIKNGSITAEEAAALESKVDHNLREKFEQSRHLTTKPNAGQFLTQQWSKISGALQPYTEEPTGVSIGKLRDIGKQIAHVPEGFELHRGISNAYKEKAKAIESEHGLDWATAEALAFGTLLTEGYPVRIAGQDAERGTFSHRHSVVHNQQTGEKYTPLLNLKSDKPAAKFTVVNSLLSEYGALGFEYGYSLEHPDQLVLWEGQFGDFVNGAQIILDNYVASAEAKWQRHSGLVMLLPHGMEGQGPEHSNAYPLRFLQSCNDDPNFFPRDPAQEKARIQRNNWQILNMTSAANYFHALRRQMKRSIRKPMVVMSPKSLLRHRGAAATLAELAEGTHFRPVIGDDHVNPSKVKRHVICSGKVYFDIIEHLEKAGVRDQVAVTRIEQISPFPFAEVEAEDKKYSHADIIFVQEEHMNFGPYSYIAPRIETAVKGHRHNVRVPYVGRPPAAAPATGAGKIHSAELANFLAEITHF